MFFLYLGGAIVGLLMVAWFIGSVVKPSPRCRRFYATFRVRAPRDNREIRLLRDLVCRELSRRAKTFYDVDMLERKAQSRGLPSDLQEAQRALDELVRLNQLTKESRAVFWSAYDIAVDFDFHLPKFHVEFLKEGCCYVPFEETVSEEV